MSYFFKVKSLEEVMALREKFSPVESEKIPVFEAFSKILARDLIAPRDMPGFKRATMDGYAVVASSTFGASESSPAWLDITGTILMGDIPNFSIGPGQAAFLGPEDEVIDITLLVGHRHRRVIANQEVIQVHVAKRGKPERVARIAHLSFCQLLPLFCHPITTLRHGQDFYRGLAIFAVSANFLATVCRRVICSAFAIRTPPVLGAF